MALLLVYVIIVLVCVCVRVFPCTLSSFVDIMARWVGVAGEAQMKVKIQPLPSRGLHTQIMDRSGVLTRHRTKLGTNVWPSSIGSLGDLKLEKGTWIQVTEWQLAVKIFPHFHRCKD